MARVEVVMPQMGESIAEGTIVKWHKKEGDGIRAGELLFEVATDKATVEYNALDEGFLRKILISFFEHSDHKLFQFYI